MSTRTIWHDSELRWSIEEMLNDKRKCGRLMKLIASKKPFDIGWVGLKKEIVSFNIRREKTGGVVKLSVCQSMDELPYDLIYDADVNGELTDEDIENINNDECYAYTLNEINTDCERDCFVRSNVKAETVVKLLMGMWNDTDTALKDDFEIVKNIVKDYISRKKRRHSRKQG